MRFATQALDGRDARFAECPSLHRQHRSAASSAAAALTPRPFCIGVAYDDSQLETIYPQPHDFPMNLIVTERRVLRVER